MDKVIKEIQESQWESDTWQDEDIPLDFDQTIRWRRKLVEKKERREERKRREKLQLLSTIYGDRWVGFRWAKN